MQGPFRELRYQLIGDDSAPTYFKVTEDTGEISASRDLRETDLEIFNVCTCILSVEKILQYHH